MRRGLWCGGGRVMWATVASVCVLAESTDGGGWVGGGGGGGGWGGREVLVERQRQSQACVEAVLIKAQV